MNIWNTIVLTIRHAVVAVLVFVGAGTATTPPPATVINLPSRTGQINTHAAATGTPVTYQRKQKPNSTLPAESTPQEATTVPAEVTSPTPQPARTVPVFIIQPTPMSEPTTTPTPAPASPGLPQAPAPQNVAGAPQTPSYTATIISPIAGSGLDREYIASDTVTSVANYIDLGLLVQDQNGAYVKDQVVTITATDSSFDKTLNGTGAVAKVYNDGTPSFVPCYMFYYEFHTAGDHTITFTLADGTTQQVTLTAK